MTQEEAYQRLELPEGVDIQEVRRRFAAMHNDCRMRIDNAPTPRLRQMFGQQLEQLKEAYSLLNGSEGMDDTIDLPRTKRVMHEDPVLENEDATVGSENISRPGLLEAYDYFGLSPEDDKATCRKLITAKLSRLKAGLQSQSLSSAKKLYEEELAKAEKLNAVLLADRQAKEALASKIAERREKERLAREKAEKAWRAKDKNERGHEKTEAKQAGNAMENTPPGKSKGKPVLLIGLSALVVGVLAFLFLTPGQESVPVVIGQNGLFGYANGDSIVLVPRFESAGAFKAGEARVSVNDSIFYIDQSGKFLRFANQANKRSADENAPEAKTIKDSLTETYLEEETLQKKNADVVKVNDKTTAHTESKKSVEELLQLGNEYLGKRNYRPAKIYYEKAIKKGSSKAMYKLGYMYSHSMGFPSDYKKAIYWYEMAVNKGEVEAMVLLGDLYANDYAGLRDNMGKREYKKAKAWYEKAINKGNHTAAKYGLGTLYHFGNGVAKDYKKAAILLEEAARNGYAASMYALGNLYSNGGYGVQKDDSAAKYWYEKGCSAGLDFACSELKNYK